VYEIGWFSTARGPTSRLLLKEAHEAIRRRDLEARISFVFCNRERGEAEDTDRFLDEVESYQIPLVAFSSTRFRDEHGGKGSGFDGKTFAAWRLDYDQEVLRRLDGFHPDIIILAGYMLVMTPPLCGRFTAINLHPAPPNGPIGTWQQVIQQLLEQTAQNAGAYMHLVTPDLDLGPVITYYTFPIGPGYDFNRIREEGVRREVPLILETIKALSTGTIAVPPAKPMDLTHDIEARLTA
jgi:phosphoribosylglycinamide formyltransferase 1